MASGLIIVRIVSQAGRNRIEIDSNATIRDLKEQISAKIGVDPDNIRFYQDINYKKLIEVTDRMTLSKAKISNGDQLFVPNKDAKFTDIIQKPKKVEEEEEKITTTTPHAKIPSTKPVSQPEGGDEEMLPNGLSKHCSHGPKGKCLHWIKDMTKIQDAKHIPFDSLLKETRSKWKGKHKPDQRCQNCIPIEDISYKMRRDCTTHKPYPLGMCNKCTPPSCILNRQKYRHVDYVSILNYPEVKAFVENWQMLHCMEQRVAWLYGYYSEDPNYPEGVRANVEAIYDPPQIGEMNGFQILHDKNEAYVDMIAASLSLEKIGWIYTSLNYESFLTSKEIREIAKMQEKYTIEHPEGVKVSKFVTIVVKPKGDSGESGLDWYMVSDQCQALERDHIFANSDDDKMMAVREPKDDEMFPAIIKEGKSVKQFDPEYFIVNVANGQPKEIQDHNILKNYDFLAQNRQVRPNKNDMKNYIKAHKSDKSSKKFANFQFLLYISKELDVDTVCAIGSKIAEEEEIEDFLVELVENLA